VPYASEDRHQPRPGLVAQGLAVGQVEITVDPQNIPRPYRKTLALYDVSERLRTSVLRRLQGRHRYDAGSDVQLRMEITGFSLRPDVVVLLPLPVLGIDRLTLDVMVRRGDRLVATFSVQGRYDQSGLIGAIGRARRLDLMLEAASFRVLSVLYGRLGRSSH